MHEGGLGGDLEVPDHTVSLNEKNNPNSNEKPRQASKPTKGRSSLGSNPRTLLTKNKARENNILKGLCIKAFPRQHVSKPL